MRVHRIILLHFILFVLLRASGPVVHLGAAEDEPSRNPDMRLHFLGLVESLARVQGDGNRRSLKVKGSWVVKLVLSVGKSAKSPAHGRAIRASTLFCSGTVSTSLTAEGRTQDLQSSRVAAAFKLSCRVACRPQISRLSSRLPHLCTCEATQSELQACY